MSSPWTLSASSLDHLLRALDTDRERAGAAYEQLRARVTGLHQWWGSDHADELADETLDRVARKLQEGTVIRDGSLGAFVRGVARMIFYETSRKRAELEPLERHPEIPASPADDEREKASTCLNRCLDSVAGNDRGWILRYYDASDGKIEARRRVASDLGIAPAALRVRAHRVRERLERCVTDCVRTG